MEQKDVTREPENAKRTTEPPSDDARANGTPSVRYASDVQLKKAHKKTMKAHAGLFRRLAL